MKHRILMVDDDAILREFVKSYLAKHSFIVDVADSGMRAVEMISDRSRRYSVVVIDFQMPGQNGAETTSKVLALDPKIRVLIYSGDSSRDAFYLSHRNGASGLLDKNEGPAVFLEEVRKLCRLAEEIQTVSDFPKNGENSRQIEAIGLVGCSKSLAQVANRVLRLKDKRGTVLILGETGTGKELIAKALHGESSHPFKAVNCAHFSMSKGTARTELFGYVKGAFTGADSDRPGIFEEAGNGTLFLDEVYSLPPDAQVGLLRALQEKVVTRVGSTKEIKVHCRIIAAAKPDLRSEIAEKQFTEDLYQRLSQNIIEVPPLRSRPEDLAPLIAHFCRRWSKENNDNRTFLMSALTRLKQYPWPGNVRELENIVFSTLNATDKKEISATDLGRNIRQFDFITDAPSQNRSLREQLEEVEKQKLIEITSDARTLREAAGKVGVSSQSLLRLLQKYNISSKLIGSNFNIRAKGIK